MPKGANISILGLFDNSNDFKHFFKNSVPFGCGGFEIYSQLLSWSNYFNYLREAWSRTLNIIWIDGMKMSQTEFWTLVRSSKNASELNIIKCWVETDKECDFGNMYGCKISSLNLKFTGSYSDWRSYPERCTNIMLGISNSSSFTSSLTKIDIRHLEMSVKEIQRLFWEINRIFWSKYSQYPIIFVDDSSY